MDEYEKQKKKKELFNRIFWKKVFGPWGRFFFEEHPRKRFEEKLPKKDARKEGDIAKDLYFQNRYYRLKSSKRLENALIRRNTFKIEIV